MRRCSDPRVRTPGHRDVLYPPKRAARRWTGAKDTRGGFMIRCLRISASAILFTALSIDIYGQTAPAQTAPAIHESVVVTATGRDTPESKVGATISVLEREEIE